MEGPASKADDTTNYCSIMLARRGVYGASADLLQLGRHVKRHFVPGSQTKRSSQRSYHLQHNNGPHRITSRWTQQWYTLVAAAAAAGGFAILAHLHQGGAIFRSAHAESQIPADKTTSDLGAKSRSTKDSAQAEQLNEFEMCMKKALDFSEAALWEYASKMLDEAESLIHRMNYNEIYLQRVLTERGGVERRLGDYQASISFLEEALDLNAADDLARATIIGELGVVYLQLGQYHEAGDKFNEQYQLCAQLAGMKESSDLMNTSDTNVSITTSLTSSDTSSASALKGKAYGQACRAIGNLGLAEYHLAVEGRGRTQAPNVKDQRLLDQAIRHLHLRVRMAQDLQDPTLFGSEMFPSARAKSWQSIGWDRLTLCYVASGETQRAVESGRQSQKLTQDFQSRDPTIRAMSRFYYGYALFHDGQRGAAKERWNFRNSEDRCTSVIALCKEPSQEKYSFLELLRSQDVDFDGYDEQGYSALDYAVLSQDYDFRYIVCDGLRSEFTRKYGDHPRLVAERIKDQTLEAERRVQYREVFQKVFRPVLLTNAHRDGGYQSRAAIRDCLDELRRRYEVLLANSREQRKTFDNFKYMRYTDFKTTLGKLPMPSDPDDMQLVHRLLHNYEDRPDMKDKYVVFFSYRWLGHNAPDDVRQTQYARMKAAMASFMKQHTELDEDEVGIWLDVASIDQIDKDVDGKQRGINALPLIVAQCNAIVSLVDETYFERAWCRVELQMMQILRDSYGLHECWNHVLEGDSQGEPGLHPAPSMPLVEDTLTYTSGSNEKQKLKLSHAGDEHTVKFLVRQSKILGRT